MLTLTKLATAFEVHVAQVGIQCCRLL